MAAESPSKPTITTLSMPGQAASSLSPNAKTSVSSALDVKPSQKLLDQFIKEKFNTSSHGLSSSSSSVRSSLANVRARASYINSQELYARKLHRLKGVIKDTIFLNGTICDEVLRTEEKLAKAKEERRFLLRKLLQYQSVNEPSVTSVKSETQTSVSRQAKGVLSGVLPYDMPPSEMSNKPKAIKRKVPSASAAAASSLHSASAGLAASSVGPGGSSEPKKKQDAPRPKKGKGANKKIIPPLMLDSLGRPIFPMALGDITLHSIGEIVPDRLSFHCPESIYPAGYCITRVFASLHKVDSKCLYTCKISDNNDGPLFEIAAEDSSDIVFKARSPIDCHNLLIQAVNKSRGGNILPVDGHGLDFFGLSHPVVQNLIQSCPGARKCSRYKWVKFEINKQETNENVAVGTRDPTVSYECFKAHMLASKYAGLINK